MGWILTGSICVVDPLDQPILINNVCRMHYKKRQKRRYLSKVIDSKHGLNVWTPQSSVSAAFTSVFDLTDSLLQMGGLEFVPQKVQGNL